MSRQMATDEYILALRQGQKLYKELTAAGKDPYPAVLDNILESGASPSVLDIGMIEIPSERIVGVKSAGRITAFTANFLPLLSVDSEFATKWISLCADHLGDTGIRDPIVCYEYLGNFYVQEGNKRVSVLKYFGAARIPGNVRRVMPPMSDDPRIQAYYEFLEFFRITKLYTVQFRRPGDYARLLAFLGKQADEEWTEADRRNFNAYFHYFQDAFLSVNTQHTDILPEEALLLWLQIYPYQDLGNLSAAQLKKTLQDLWEDVVSVSNADTLNVQTKAEDAPKASIFTRMISGTPEHVNVAFVHQLNPAASTWVLGHEDGRKHIENLFGEQVTCRSYFDANTPEATEKCIDQAIAEGAEVVFTTAPLLSRDTLKAAVKHPKIRFYNCSVDQPYSSIHTYYGRIYEAKFITGAIAGAMAQNDRIGYIASYPIFGVPASINAFALGAQMTNPRAQIELRWSCCEGSPQADFFTDGIRVVSNRDVPTKDQMYLNFCNYGTYLLDDRGGLIPLASALWEWGKFYEFVIRNILSGAWKDDKNSYGAVNYWLGMENGIIDIKLSDKLPQGMYALSDVLKKGLCSGTLDPFARRIIAQDGSIKNDGSQTLSAQEVLHMDWLCDNVVGSIPTFDQILPMSQAMVRELGIYRDKIIVQKEVSAREDFDHLR